MTAPTLTTARLVLRPATMADFPAYAAFVTGARARFMGGPHDRAKAWDWFCNDVAQWSLLNLGALIITLEGRAIGQVAVCGGPIFPEPELGWFLFDQADEGHGYATEAARAMADWALGPRGLETLVSYIDPANTASARLAERLGARRDGGAATPGGMATGVWRLHAGVVLETERLVLRRPSMRDLPESVAFWSSDRCRMMGGPIPPEETAKSLQKVIDLWDLRGFGLFALTLKGSDKAVGFAGPWQPVSYPEPEIGWNLWDASLEGKGLAYEAASAARDWFFANTSHRTAVSYTHPDNTRSHRLCERLGAVYDPDALQLDPPERVYRHVDKGGRA